MSKADRHKNIREDFAVQFLGNNEEFKAYASSGIAAKIANLRSVYIMYLNVIDGNKETK